MPDTKKADTVFNCRIRIRTLLTIALLLAYPALTKATDNYWNVDSGDWSDTNPSPWSLGTVPTSTDYAYIQNGNTAKITQTGEYCDSLVLGSTNSGTVEMSYGSLTAGYWEYIGYSGTGAFTQTGGINTFSFSSGPYYAQYLGYNFGSTGTYNLSGTGQLSAAAEYIGYSGTGTFTQTGGTNTIPFTSAIPDPGLHLGYKPNSTGTYNLSDTGYLSAKSETIGDLGTGTFNQTGGTNSITGSLTLGSGSLSSGTYFLSGTGILSCNVNEYIGKNGPGTFYQSGGTNSILNSNTLYVGYGSGATGTYNLSGDGQLTATEYIGYITSTGIFNQTGGINNAILNLGGSSSNGTYNLKGGTLITHYIQKGQGFATFNFGGGTLQASETFSTSMPMKLTGDGGNANIDTVGYTVTLSGILSGSGGLNKLGSGTLILNANNSYTGNTVVQAGTLWGSVGSSQIIDILDGATLKSGLYLSGTHTLTGSGTFIGDVTVLSGSHIDPGDSVGTLTISDSGSLGIGPGAVLDFELGSISESDKISMSSSNLNFMNINGNGLDFSYFNFTALDGFGPGTYTLIDAGTISGNLGKNLTGTIGDFTGTISISNNDLILTVVPEPGTWMLLAACLGLFVGKRMRREG
jgi:autotransporter-associated beta strand protein